MEKIIDNLSQEMRRGMLVLSVMSQLKSPKYGYSLVQSLNDKGLDIDQNTIYPLMRRLEKQNLLKSDWNLEEQRPRKYYVLSDKGNVVYEKLVVIWKQNEEIMKKLFEKGE